MKKRHKLVSLLLLLSVLATGCGSSVVNNEKFEASPKMETVTVGFSQLGAESDWRNTNTASMIEAFNGEGYTLVYKNGQQKQSNQITAIRMFIQQEVDYIVLAPAMETGSNAGM